MNCKFCNQNRQLIKAHIIPKSFFRELSGNKGPSLLVEDTPGTFPKRLPIGPYDKKLVCCECEQQFGDWDDYAQQFMLKENGFKELKKENAVIGYIVDKFDYENLKLFFISLLWRASATQLEFFNNVALGPYEKIAHDHILSKNPGDEEHFSVVISKFSDPIGKIILEPVPATWFQVKYYRFFLTGYMVAIKVDKRKSPGYLGRLQINRNQSLIIPVKERPSDIELDLILNAAKKIGK